MTTSNYLNSVLNILPAVQARNISDLLNELQVSGEIKNADEYRAKLQELATAINDTNPKPSFKQIRGLIWHLASSDGHNIMMKAAQRDIDAIFQQTDEIGSKVNDHHFLVLKNLAADMERGLNDQENTIRRLEWLANQSNEFSLALVNSFVSSSLFKVPRSQLGAENLYFDNRTYLTRTEAELPSAVVSEHGERLILDVTNEPQVLPVSAELRTDSSSYGTQIQTDVDNQIENIIDGTKGTFWSRNVYLSEAVPKVTTVVELSLGTGKDIDYIIIQGAAELPFFVDSIESVATDGSRLELLSSTVEVNGKTRIDFTKILARSVVITFSTKSYLKVDYSTDKNNLIFDYLESPFDEVAQSESFNPLIEEVINSQQLNDILNIPTAHSSIVNSFLYPFALDNVWFGDSSYEDTGIFVSKPLKGQNLGVCAIQSQDKTTTEESVNNTIEYEVIKKDLTPKLKETKFPIPKLGQRQIVSERLLLTKIDSGSLLNSGALRFCPYVDPAYDPAADDSPIKVYKNGEILSVESDYQIAINISEISNTLAWKSSLISPGSDLRLFSDYLLNPAKTWIKINNPDATAVYTIDYTIRTSDTHIDDKTMWLDKDKTVFLSDEGKVYFIRENPDVTIDSELYLQITLRRNTAKKTSTPELYEYALLSASYYN